MFWIPRVVINGAFCHDDFFPFFSFFCGGNPSLGYRILLGNDESSASSDLCTSYVSAWVIFPPESCNLMDNKPEIQLWERKQGMAFSWPYLFVPSACGDGT